MTVAGAAAGVGSAGAATPRRHDDPAGPVVTTRTLTASGQRPSAYTVSLQVPVLHGGTVAASARISAELVASARHTIAGFVHELAKAPLPKDLPVKHSSLTGYVTTSIVSGDVVSFTSYESFDQAGAAHPEDDVQTASFDAATGAPYRLADLFRPGSDYLAVLSRWSRTLLIRQFGSAVKGFVDHGTAPKPANFQGFALSPFGLQLSWSMGAVGPDVISGPSIMIPFRALAGVARPGGPLPAAEAVQPAQMALLPATTPSAVAECYEQRTAKQSSVPNTCAGGKLNVAAWNELAGYAGKLLGLGPSATAHDVLEAVCSMSDVFQVPPSQARQFEQLAAAYHGWRFSTKAALSGYPASCPPYVAPGTSSASAATSVPTVGTATITRHGSQPTPYRVDVTYPVIRSIGAATSRINRTLRDEAHKSVAGFLRQLPEHLQKGRPGGTSTLTATPETDLLAPGLLSVSSLGYQYPAGAAHGISVDTTDTFDLATGARVELSGLFKPGTDVLGFLSHESRTMLAKRFASQVGRQTIDEGTTPKAINFRDWAVTPFGLDVTFGDYQVGPYAIGMPTIRIPFSAMTRIARPAGPLAVARAYRPVRMALLPATTPPAVDECSASASGNEAFPPVTCDGNKLNVAAWDQLAGYGARVLGLGPQPTDHQVLVAVCADRRQFQLTAASARFFVQVPATYFDWHFASSPLAGFPRDCPGTPGPG